MGKIRDAKQALTSKALPKSGHLKHGHVVSPTHHAHTGGKEHAHRGGPLPHDHETTRERFARRYGGQPFAPTGDAGTGDGPPDNPDGPPEPSASGQAWHHAHPLLVVLIAAIVALAIVAIFTPNAGTPEHKGPTLALAPSPSPRPTATPQTRADGTTTDATPCHVGARYVEALGGCSYPDGRPDCEAGYMAIGQGCYLPSPQPSATATATATGTPTPCAAAHVADCAVSERFGQSCGLVR